MWGTVVSSWRIERARNGLEWKAWALNFSGVALALYVFMVDSIRVAHGGVAALRNVLPQQFNWPLFCMALLLMAAPILELLWRLRRAVIQTKTSILVDGDWEYGAEQVPSSVKRTAKGGPTEREAVKLLTEVDVEN
jgi:hypothetical protein